MTGEKRNGSLCIDKGGAEIPIDVENTEWGGQRGDGAVTGQELDGWTQEYLATSKIFACCTQNVSVDLEKREVSITIGGELALRAEQVRRMIVDGAFTGFQSRLGECLRMGRVITVDGQAFPETYTNSNCP